MTTPTSAPGPTVLDALSLAAEAADELVVRTVRDTHLATTERVHAVVDRCTGPFGTVTGLAHRGIARGVYAGLTGALHGASVGLDRLAATGVGPRLEDDPRGRFLNATVNGLIGDRLLAERPQLAIPMAIRRGGHDVEPEADVLSATYPDASPDLVVLLHGLFESETVWRLHRDRTGTTYSERLAARGWSPLELRFNSGLPLRENGVALAALLQRVVEAWPVPVERIALVGHSMGGLVIRAAGAVVREEPRDEASRTVAAAPPPSGRDWNALVTDVVTLGTPHLGAPVARGVGHGSRGLSFLPETAAFGRILDWRSRGVHDLVAGLTDDVPPLPHARYHLVAGTVTASRRHPVGHVVGDLLVRPESAFGRDRHGVELFPGADTLHVGSTDHFGLANHPRVLAAMEQWLG